MHPAGWAPEQPIVAQGLRDYGYDEHTKRIGRNFLRLAIGECRRTGRLPETYNEVDGGMELPNARYGNATMHGWTAAAAVVVGRAVIGRTADPQPSCGRASAAMSSIWSRSLRSNRSR
ncbi:trehalase family glycosidase [Jiangella alkaliphila]